MGQTSKGISEELQLGEIKKSARLNPAKINKKLKNAAPMGEVMVWNVVVFRVDLSDNSLSLGLVYSLRFKALE